MKKWIIALGPVLPYVIGGVIVLVGGYYLITKLYSQFGAGAPDPGGGAASTGVIDGILNQTAEIGSSSLNYTGALQETVTNPIETAQSITAPLTDAISKHDSLWYATFGVLGK